jgi:hypothetical protein
MSIQFWQRWLIVVTGGVILYGFSLILLPDVMQNLFNTLFFSAPGATYSADAQAYITLAQGVLGAVVIGWMLMVMSILVGAFRRGERSAWNTLALSLLCWFVIDTGFSLAVGNVAHALFNLLFLVMFAIPLAATYRQFRERI